MLWNKSRSFDKSFSCTTDCWKQQISGWDIGRKFPNPSKVFGVGGGGSQISILWIEYTCSKPPQAKCGFILTHMLSDVVGFFAGLSCFQPTSSRLDIVMFVRIASMFEILTRLSFILKRPRKENYYPPWNKVTVHHVKLWNRPVTASVLSKRTLDVASLHGAPLGRQFCQCKTNQRKTCLAQSFFKAFPQPKTKALGRFPYSTNICSDIEGFQPRWHLPFHEASVPIQFHPDAFRPFDLQQYHPWHLVFEGVHGIDIINVGSLKFQNWLLSLRVVSTSPSQWIVKISSNHGCVWKLGVFPKSHGKWLDLT